MAKGETEIPIACTLSNADEAERRALASELFECVEAVEELPDGYALRLLWQEPIATRIVTFITAERACCPFMEFELKFEAADGPVRLHIRGPEGTKAFIEDWFPQR